MPQRELQVYFFLGLRPFEKCVFDGISFLRVACSKLCVVTSILRKIIRGGEKLTQLYVITKKVVGAFIFNVELSSLGRLGLPFFFLISVPEIATLLNSWCLYPVNIDVHNLFPSLYWLIGSSTTSVVQLFEKYLVECIWAITFPFIFFPLTLFFLLLSHFSFQSYIVC